MLRNGAKIGIVLTPPKLKTTRRDRPRALNESFEGALGAVSLAITSGSAEQFVDCLPGPSENKMTLDFVSPKVSDNKGKMKKRL